MKFLTSLDLSSNQILNARLQNLSAAPTGATAGTIYFNTTTSSPEVYSGSAWLNLDATKATNIPIAALAVNPLARANHTGTQAWSTITGTPTTLGGYGIVDAFNGTFAALTGKPTTIGGYGITDAFSGEFSALTGRPTTLAGYGITDAFNGSFAALTGKPTTLAGYGIADAFNGSFSALTGRPTTLAGYGITDGASLASPAFTGTPTAPTATANTNSTQLATTSFVATAISNLVSSSPDTLNTLNELAAALGNDPNFATTVSTNIASKAPLASPALTGTPTAPTAAPGTSTTQLATTAFVTAAVAGSTGALRYSATIGDGAATSITVTHGLGTRDVIVSLREAAAPYGVVVTDVQVTSVNDVTFIFTVAPAAGSLRTTILG